VLVSEHNRLDNGRYYDVESSSSFAFEQRTGKASDVKSYLLESKQADLVYVPVFFLSFLFHSSSSSICQLWMWMWMWMWMWTRGSECACKC